MSYLEAYVHVLLISSLGLEKVYGSFSWYAADGL